MGYLTNARGTIRIVPALQWGQVKDSPFLPNGWPSADDQFDVALVVSESERETSEGVLLVREVSGVEQRYEEEARNYHIADHLQRIVDAFPDREFTGRFDLEGEENGDLWRLKVVGRLVTRFDPAIVWPEASE